jgi:pyruvate/2-oxoglutarate dehydrogenase complex dihydrolipoamide acyltransferase (E2) component
MSYRSAKEHIQSNYMRRLRALKFDPEDADEKQAVLARMHAKTEAERLKLATAAAEAAKDTEAKSRSAAAVKALAAECNPAPATTRKPTRAPTSPAASGSTSGRAATPSPAHRQRRLRPWLPPQRSHPRPVRRRYRRLINENVQRCGTEGVRKGFLPCLLSTKSSPSASAQRPARACT